MTMNRIGSLPKKNVYLSEIEDNNQNNAEVDNKKLNFRCPNCDEPLMDELSQMARWYNVGQIVHPWTKQKLLDTIDQSPYYYKEEDTQEDSEVNFFNQDEDDLSFLDELEEEKNQDNFFKLDNLNNEDISYSADSRLLEKEESKFENTSHYFDSSPDENSEHKKIRNKGSANYYRNYSLGNYKQRPPMSAA